MWSLRLHCCHAVAVCAALLVLTVVASIESDVSPSSSSNTRLLEPWQECSIFLAPSSSGGYGVFAAREFAEHEIVEVAPFFLVAEHDAPFILNSVIQDYNYGYAREGPNQQLHVMATVVWGMTMWYNHHSQAHNLNWTSYGREPSTDNPHSFRAVGFFANRRIEPGEELFSTYGVDDGGARWFRERGLTITTMPTDATRIPTEQLQIYQQHYCSKIYADMDDTIFVKRFSRLYSPPSFYNTARLAPSTIATHDDIRIYNDPNYPHAIARVPISKGDRIELAPALVLDRTKVAGTPMAPLVYYFHEWNSDQQSAIRTLREQGYYVVQYQGWDNQWRREDHFTTLEDSVILPAAGWIGRIERVGDDAPNCHIRILPSDFHKYNTTSTTQQQQQEQQQVEKEQNPFRLGNAGIVLELIATSDIAVGERLRVDMPATSTTLRERIALFKELERTGQIYTLFDHHEQYQLQQREKESLRRARDDEL